MDTNFYDRIVYRPEYGYSFAYYQARIDQVFTFYPSTSNDMDPNDIIELYEALQYLLQLDEDNTIVMFFAIITTTKFNIQLMNLLLQMICVQKTPYSHCQSKNT